jgi:hypothetical protein
VIAAVEVVERIGSGAAAETMESEAERAEQAVAAEIAGDLEIEPGQRSHGELARMYQ